MVKKVNGKNSRSKRVKSKSLKKLVRSLRKQVKSRSRRRRQSKHGGAGAGEPPFKVGHKVYLVRNQKQEHNPKTLRHSMKKSSLPAKWFIGKIKYKYPPTPHIKQMYKVAYTEDDGEKMAVASTNKTKMWHIYDWVPDDMIEQQRIVSDIESKMELPNLSLRTQNLSLSPVVLTTRTSGSINKEAHRKRTTLAALFLPLSLAQRASLQSAK